MSQPTLERTISLPGAVLLIIGYVVGATIFILPGSLAGEVGPSVYLAYILAGVPALFACFVMALIGSAIPATGSIYLLIRDVLAPAFGFLYLWFMVSLSAVVVPLVAFGFADYFLFFNTGLDTRTVALMTIALVVAVNYCGMKVASGLQNLMVIGFVLALLVFGVGGLVYGAPALLRPMFPEGLSPVMVAATTAYFSYAGVFVIAEVAGEVKNPGQNIPRAIFLSFAVVILLYTLVPLALASVLPWRELASTPMAVITAAREIFPNWVANLVSVGALLAAATSINAILMGLSRDFFTGASAGLFPPYFGVVDSRFGTPGRAVLALGVLSLAGTYMGASVVQYAQIAVMGLMVVQVMTGIALLMLPSRLPQVYAAAPFKLGIASLRLVGGVYITFSLVFLVLLCLEQPQVVLPGLGFLLAGFVWYALFGRRGAGKKLL